MNRTEKWNKIVEDFPDARRYETKPGHWYISVQGRDVAHGGTSDYVTEYAYRNLYREQNVEPAYKKVIRRRYGWVKVVPSGGGGFEVLVASGQFYDIAIGSGKTRIDALKDAIDAINSGRDIEIVMEFFKVDRRDACHLIGIPAKPKLSITTVVDTASLKFRNLA